MHEDAGEPNTKSAVAKIWGVLEGKQEGFPPALPPRNHSVAVARARRWVAYAGEKEAPAVPAEWHGWLHYTIDTPLWETGKHPWQKPHIPNATGTHNQSVYRPPGHDYRGGHRAPVDGDYEVWTPGR